MQVMLQMSGFAAMSCPIICDVAQSQDEHQLVVPCSQNRIVEVLQAGCGAKVHHKYQAVKYQRQLKRME